MVQRERAASLPEGATRDEKSVLLPAIRLVNRTFPLGHLGVITLLSKEAMVSRTVLTSVSLEGLPKGLATGPKMRDSRYEDSWPDCLPMFLFHYT